MPQLVKVGGMMGPRRGGGGPAQFLTNWRQGALDAKNGNASMYLNKVGDSQTGGAFSDGNIAGLWSSSPPALLAAALASGYSLPTDKHQHFWGDQNIYKSLSSSYPNVAHHEPRISALSAATWGLTATPGTSVHGGGCLIFNVADTGSLAFTPTINFDTAEVYDAAAAGFGTGNVNIDGGANTAVNSNVSERILKTTVTDALGAHTINRVRVAGTNSVLGMIAYDSSVKHIFINSFGYFSGTTADQALATKAWNALNHQKFFAPKLTTIKLGTNDMLTAVALATSQANMQTIITAAKLTGDVLIITPPPLNIAGATQAVQDAFNAMLKTLASANGCRVLDLRALLGTTWVAANAAGYMADNNHQSASGYAVECAAEAALLGAALA